MPQRRVEITNVAARRKEEERPILISAATGEGLDRLLASIETRLAARRLVFDVKLDAGDGRSLNWLYQNAEVLARSAGADGRVAFRVRVDPSRAELLRRKFGLL
jgi:GTP-binding protein HflX